MLTRREQAAYAFIRTFISRHGHGPLLSEIALGIGIQSKGTAHRYVQALAQQGLIRLKPGRHRSITLSKTDTRTDPGFAAVRDTPNTLPLLGRIAAGLPIEAIPDQNNVNLSDFFMGPNRYILKVQGESMIEAGILDDDMVVIEQRDHAADGEIVVALIDNNEATLKYLRNNRDGSVTLTPANHTMAPMIYAATRVRIQGIVVGQMRSYR
jgi:repressor LexA